MLVGNDISSYQGNINWDLYVNNSHFVIIKATEGIGYTDSRFIQNRDAARLHKHPRGFYHFARPDKGNGATQEAGYFSSIVGPLQEGEILALDYEANWNGNVVNWCKDFLDHLFKLTTVKPLIYLNQSQVKRYDWSPIVNAGYGLWIAAYLGNPHSPENNNFEKGQWPFAAMQQWTSSQMVPGIDVKVDGDAFFGDIPAFKRYGYKTPAPIEDDKDRQIRELKQTIEELQTKHAQELAEVKADCQKSKQQFKDDIIKFIQEKTI